LIPSSSHYDVTHMTTAVAMVRQGLGITVLPRLAVPELNVTGMVCKPLKDASARRTIGLLHRRDRGLSPACQVFSEKVRAAILQVESSLPPLRAAPR
ncbi:MAG TPA: LysR substrate-binding domain-containing protein, partial [Noviherbaspirillum sp.]|nr:LysR substrate-binding domain-containing protein [Noviherbaspirillum sp.]